MSAVTESPVAAVLSSTASNATVTTFPGSSTLVLPPLVMPTTSNHPPIFDMPGTSPTPNTKPILTGKLSVQIEHFPNYPAGKQYCYVWTKKDGARQIFGCDSQENCQQNLRHWQDRARTAAQNGWDTL